MILRNETDRTIAWFCFNNVDVVKETPLLNGTVAPNEEFNFTPPKNETGKYFIRFTEVNKGPEMTSITCGTDRKVCIEVVNDVCQAKVVDSVRPPVVKKEVVETV